MHRYIYIYPGAGLRVCNGRQTFMYRDTDANGHEDGGGFMGEGGMGNSSYLLNLPVYSGKAATNGEKLMCQIHRSTDKKPLSKSWSERRWVNGS